MPRRFLRSRKVRLKTPAGWTNTAPSPERRQRLQPCCLVVLPRALLSWLAAGAVLPEDTDSPGEIKAGVETVEDTKTKAKSKNSRARRLSYVANAEGVGPQVQSLTLSACKSLLPQPTSRCCQTPLRVVNVSVVAACFGR